VGKKVVEPWSIEDHPINECYVDLLESRHVDLGDKVFHILTDATKRKAGKSIVDDASWRNQTSDGLFRVIRTRSRIW
jgi:hypothetical protein